MLKGGGGAQKVLRSKSFGPAICQFCNPPPLPPVINDRSLNKPVVILMIHVEGRCLLFSHYIPAFVGFQITSRKLFAHICLFDIWTCVTRGMKADLGVAEGPAEKKGEESTGPVRNGTNNLAHVKFLLFGKFSQICHQNKAPGLLHVLINYRKEYDLLDTGYPLKLYFQIPCVFPVRRQIFACWLTRSK